MGRRHQKPNGSATLDDIPDSELDRLAELGFDGSKIIRTISFREQNMTSPGLLRITRGSNARVAI
ncbi:MAG: hypothetical protein ACLQIB_52570 [Isosphaeraceae bacterium]